MSKLTQRQRCGTTDLPPRLTKRGPNARRIEPFSSMGNKHVLSQTTGLLSVLNPRRGHRLALESGKIISGQRVSDAVNDLAPLSFPSSPATSCPSCFTCASEQAQSAGTLPLKNGAQSLCARQAEWKQPAWQGQCLENPVAFSVRERLRGDSKTR